MVGGSWKGVIVLGRDVTCGWRTVDCRVMDLMMGCRMVDWCGWVL